MKTTPITVPTNPIPVKADDSTSTTPVQAPTIVINVGTPNATPPPADPMSASARGAGRMGPARTAPPTANDGEPSRPSNSSIVPQRAVTDTRPSNHYPRPGSDSTTNTTGKSGREMPYGTQPQPDIPVRPGGGIVIDINGE